MHLQNKDKSEYRRNEYNNNLKCISFGFSSFSSDGRRGKYWIVLHNDNNECELVSKGPADLLKNNGLRTILDQLETTRGITITGCNIIGIPYNSGVEARIKVRELCRMAGLGSPLRIARTSSIKSIGYMFNQYTANLSSTSRMVFVCIDDEETEVSLLENGDGVGEITYSERRAYSNNSLLDTLKDLLVRNIDVLKSITRKELEKSWDLKIIVQCSSKVSVSGFIRMLRAIPVADTEIEFWDEEQLLELGTKCITAKLQEKEFAADFLWLDITTQGYRVCRADNGKCLLEIKANSTIPIEVIKTFEEETFMTKLEVYENGTVVGIMNKPEIPTGVNIKEAIRLDIGADGSVTWNREKSIGD